jgi:hypothetical protein
MSARNEKSEQVTAASENGTGANKNIQSDWENRRFSPKKQTN